MLSKATAMGASRYIGIRLRAGLVCIFLRAMVSVLLLLNSTSVIADGSPEFLHSIWRTEDGLANPCVRAVMQSRDGYLWLATDDGLTRFDGVRFTDIERRTIPEKLDRWIVALLETSDGSIWASSINGGLVRYKDGALKRFTVVDGLAGDYILTLYEDKKGNLWIGSATGLSRYSNGKFENLASEAAPLAQAVRAVLEDSKGNLWIGTAFGLSAFRDGQFKSYTTDNLLVHNGVMQLLEDREGNLWIGTSGGLTCIAANRKLSHYTTDEGLAHNAVRSLLEDRDGNIWVGTQGGLQMVGSSEFCHARITGSTSPDFEDVPFVYSVCQDHEGSLWIGTNMGLNRLKRQKFSTITKDNGLPHNLVTAVMEDSKRGLWIGTYGGGLTRFSGSKTVTYGKKEGLPSSYILALHESYDGDIWIGTDGGGVARLSNGEITNYDFGEKLPANTVRAILEDSRGYVWIGSNDGVCRMVNGKVIPERRVPLCPIKSIIEDTENNVWFATKYGLARWFDGQVQVFNVGSGLLSLAICTVFQDSDGRIWVGTEDRGIQRLNADGRFSPAPPNFQPRVLHMVEDDLGNFWFATTVGVLRASKKELNDFAAGAGSSVKLDHYDRSDGMKRAQCNGIAQPAGMKAKDGRVWFPTMYGAVSFDPAKMASNKERPAVVVEQVIVDGELMKVPAGTTVPPGDGQLEFHFTALSFEAPEKVRFKFMLEGFDKDWQDAGTRRFARYTNLQPGTYRFHVKACNNDGVWNEQGIELPFVLAPHFYQTHGFYAACVLGMVLSGMGINALRLRQMKKREQHLTRLVEQRTSKLQEAIRSMERFNYSIAHDLRAPLRAVRGFTRALAEDYGHAFDGMGKEFCQRIDSSMHRMDQLIDDLLIYGRLTHAEISISSVELELVLTKVMCDFEEQIREKKAKIEIVRPLPNIMANQTLLEQILENLVGNALKFTVPETPPEVRIWTEKTATGTRILVRDNGIGIKPEHQTRIFRVFERLHTNEVYPGTGIGLAIVDKAAERMDGSVGVTSELGKGSCFWIELPDRRK